MPITLDHIFILTTPLAPEAERLINLGLTEGTSNTHPGQGTANRRFFLPNFTIELLYINDEHEAAKGTGSCLGMLNRTQNKNASPFGIVVRASKSAPKPTFPHWLYTPDYFNGKMSFLVGENSAELNEPLCICMPPELPPAKTLPAEYANPDWTLSRVIISTPTTEPSEALHYFAQMDNVEIELNKPHNMTLIFNGGEMGATANLSPELALTIKY